MSGLFDNFFGKIGTALNGGKSHQHYGGASQVNTGSYYNYHSNSTNNKYWMPKSDMKMATDKLEEVNDPNSSGAKLRMNSVTSMNSMDEEPRSRNNSVTSDKIDL